MIVADSSIWIDHFNDKATPKSKQFRDVLVEKRVGVGDLILMEVLQGIRANRRFSEARADLETLYLGPMVGKKLAVAAAQNYRKLRAEGVTPRKTIDVLIATFCIERGHTLLHADRDFDVMKDLLGLRTL